MQEEKERIELLKKLIEEHPEEIQNLNYDDLKVLQEELLMEKIKKGD